VARWEAGATLVNLGVVTVGGTRTASGVLRFGVFEVDLRTGELRKQGLRLKLPSQSFQVLKLLAEHPGELVSREELREKLWPADTFVDFDHGVNAAVNRLREALGDSADNPRFVETLPRRGYRLIGPVEWNSAESERSESASQHRDGNVETSASGVVARSAMFSPSDVGLLPDDPYHSLAFRPGETSGWFLSEPKRVKIERTPELVQRALSGRIVTNSQSANFSNLQDWLNDLATKMRAIVQHNRGRVPRGLNRVDRGPLEELAYLARTHFGCELFLFATPQIARG